MSSDSYFRNVSNSTMFATTVPSTAAGFSSSWQTCTIAAVRTVAAAVVETVDKDVEARKLTIKNVNAAAYGVTLPIICAFGIIGNVLNLMTLRSPLLQAVSYMYLRALAVADLLCMIFVLEFALRINNVLTDGLLAKAYQAHAELPLINVFISCGILIVIALTVERYISVVFPVRFREWNTARRAFIIIVASCTLCLLLWIPMCWERRVCVKFDNGTVIYNQEENAGVKFTTTYKAYKWIREAIVRCLPVLSLAYFNIHIIVAFKRVQSRRARMTGRRGTSAGGEIHQRSTDDKRLMVLLASIAILFFICNLPAAINLIIIQDKLHQNVQYQIFRAIANLLEIANHAVNFYIFCMCSKDYRQEFIKTFPCVRRIQRAYDAHLRRLRRKAARNPANIEQRQQLLSTISPHNDEHASAAITYIPNGSEKTDTPVREQPPHAQHQHHNTASFANGKVPRDSAVEDNTPSSGVDGTAGVMGDGDIPPPEYASLVLKSTPIAGQTTPPGNSAASSRKNSRHSSVRRSQSPADEAIIRRSSKQSGNDLANFPFFNEGFRDLKPILVVSSDSGLSINGLIETSNEVFL